MLRVLAIFLGAVVVAVGVWLTVAASVVDLASAAWWAPAAVLVVPGVMGGLYLLERRRGY